MPFKLYESWPIIDDEILQVNFYVDYLLLYSWDCEFDRAQNFFLSRMDTKSGKRLN